MHEKTPNPAIILASTSPSRLSLLARIKIFPDQILPADIDESELRGELPKDLVTRLAKAKATKIADQIAIDAIIIGADTVVACGRRILPKALTRDDVQYCLNLLSGRRHVVYTSVCVIRKSASTLVHRQKLVKTTVKFKRLAKSEIEFYCNLDEGLNKAGGCAISGYAESFVSFLSGSHSNVQGLPLLETRNLLTCVGLRLA